MGTYKVFIDIDRPEKCLDCRFRVENTCVLDSGLKYVSLDGSRPYWCALNFAIQGPQQRSGREKKEVDGDGKHKD